MRERRLLRIGVGLVALAIGLAPPGVAAGRDRYKGVHGVWVWDTDAVIGSEAGLAGFISALKEIGATDAYLYLPAQGYAAPGLARAVAVLSRAGLHLWGLEGSREYFSDVDGPGRLYAAADALVAFNQGHGAGFRGFVSDLEPQDGQGADFPTHFHNGLADSRLAARQAADRLALMKDWVSMHQGLRARMAAAGLRYAAAVPSWTGNYEGEPVHVVVDGRRELVQQPLMRAVNDYIVMCYNTDPDIVVACLRGTVDGADRLGGGAPTVVSVMETHAGAGRHISYADDPVKDSRRAVLGDLQVIKHALQGFPSFGGVDIHDWRGWSALPP